MKYKVALLFIGFTVYNSLAFSVQAASLTLSPAGGTYVVGSTFDVALVLNTEDESVNAISTFLEFPPDKLQLVSPSSGKSSIDLWVVPPRYNNVAGNAELQGVITGGTRVNNALIATLTFRVRSTGTAIVRITDDSRVLLHDGEGTDALRNIGSGIYTLKLPPPAGPIVVSETHPDETHWYSLGDVLLAWQLSNGRMADGFSYTINDIPLDTPDIISEGTNTSFAYTLPNNGIFYFHVRALREGVWGGTTHFVIHADTIVPAEFPIIVNPSPRITDDQPVIRFETTDAVSGIDHFELKLLSHAENGSQFEQPLFIEARSPFILPTLQTGDYDILVRAYDKAGNYREEAQPLIIQEPFFGVVFGEEIGSERFWIKYGRWLLLSVIIILLLVGYEIGRRLRRKKDDTSKKESM